MGGISGFGTELKVNDKVIGSLTSIGGIEMSADTIDVSTHDSADGFREYVGGMKDGGEVPIEGNFANKDEGQEELLTAFESGEVQSCIITFPDESTWEFDAIVTAYGHTEPMDDKIGFASSLKVTGKPDFTEGS